MMKKMDEYGDMNAMKDEGFSSDAQRKAAFASGYKEKGKKKDEMMKMKMKKESIDPSCPVCEGEACQCAQSPSDTESVSEMAMNAMKMNAMKMPIRATYGKMNAMKTGDDDMTPMNNMKLNAMVKDPHKSKKDDPKKDMNAGYMKSDVRADVKNNGGADMAKVKDKPQMMPAMKKINAMYKTEKYLDEKEGSIQNTVAQMFEAENRLVEVQDKNLEKMIADYLKKGGTITKLPPALAKGMKASGQSTFKVGDKGIIKSMYKMKDVREFVDTYNRHFLLNYKAEELLKNNINEAKYVIGMQDASYFKGNEMMSAMRAGNIDKLDMHAGEGTITFTANNPGEAQRNAEKAIKDYINKETRNDRNALFAFNDLELEQVDNDGPTRQQEQSLKRVLDKYSNKAMFNTPNGKASGPLQKFADEESLGDMAVQGVM